MTNFTYGKLSLWITLKVNTQKEALELFQSHPHKITVHAIYDLIFHNRSTSYTSLCTSTYCSVH